jgi:hypothetical protein
MADNGGTVTPVTAGTVTPVIEILGTVWQNRHAVRIEGFEARLTDNEMTALLRLVLGRLRTFGGRTVLSEAWEDRNSCHITAHRLRRALDAAVGGGAGARLVVSAGRGEFVLAVRREDIVVYDAVRELGPRVSSELVEGLIREAERLRLCLLNPFSDNGRG